MNLVIPTVGLNDTGSLQREADIVTQTDIEPQNLLLFPHAQASEILDDVLPSRHVQPRQHCFHLRTGSRLPESGQLAHPIEISTS